MRHIRNDREANAFFKLNKINNKAFSNAVRREPNKLKGIVQTMIIEPSRLNMAKIINYKL